VIATTLWFDTSRSLAASLVSAGMDVGADDEEKGSSDMLTIHNFARGARGLRVIWLCEELGLDYRVENHPFPVPAAFRALNPLGTVPFLEHNGGVAINESIAIMLYIAQTYGPTSLLPASDPVLLARCLQLTLFGETELGMNLNPLIAARFLAGESDKRNWSVIGLEDRVKRALAYLQTLVGNRAFLVGDALSLADISVSCGVGIWQSALGGDPPSELATYQDRLRSRPAYRRAQARCQQQAS
jgi:glutathione S-transferase